MLVLSRKLDEEVLIGDAISVKVVSILGDRIRLGITAPADVKIFRSELLADPPKPSVQREKR
jgi:carbon storage regulator